MSDERYIRWLQENEETARRYYIKSVNKTYQQFFLEEVILKKLIPPHFKPEVIADIACGSGTLSFHISKIYPSSRYILLDLNPGAIELAKEINRENKNITYLVEDFLNTTIQSQSVDIAFCAQTLFVVSKPKKFLYKILDILKPGGYFIISSLFNTEHDVDLFVKVRDNTRKGNVKINYNTFSKFTISKWLKGKVSFFDITPFQMPVELPKESRGIGSYTLELKNGEFITISGGLLLNWGFLYGQK